MNDSGLKIKNIKAGTLYGYNLGIRDRFESNDAVFYGKISFSFIYFF